MKFSKELIREVTEACNVKDADKFFDAIEDFVHNFSEATNSACEVWMKDSAMEALLLAASTGKQFKVSRDSWKTSEFMIEGWDLLGEDLNFDSYEAILVK